MADIAKEAPKKSGWKKLLIGGTLTAIAAGIFVTSTGNFTGSTANEAPQGAKVTETVRAEDGAGYPAMTKDGKELNVKVNVGALDRGKVYPDDASFQKELNDQLMFAVMTTFYQYNEADIGANIANIQQAISKQLTVTVNIGNELKAGQLPQMAKEGVNFSAPQITKVTDAGGGTVWQPNIGARVMNGLGL